MSKLSKFIREKFARGGEDRPARLIIKDMLGAGYSEFEELARTLVVAMDHADENNDGRLDKREIVTAVLRGTANALNISIPGWLLNRFVEEIVARLRMPDFSIPVPAPTPASAED